MCCPSVKNKIEKRFCELEIFNSIKLRKDLSFLHYVLSVTEMEKNV